MAINNKECNYKLHEFLGEECVKEELYTLYKTFFDKSTPLSFKTKTLSNLNEKIESYFGYLTENTKIIYARKKSKIIGFIAFDLERKTQSYSVQTAHLAKLNACEFVFAATDCDNLFELKRAAYDIFQLLKEKYRVLYIVGNVNRERKKDKYINTIVRIFNFQVFDKNVALYEIP
jgi:hypothetical protein